MMGSMTFDEDDKEYRYTIQNSDEPSQILNTENLVTTNTYNNDSVQYDAISFRSSSIFNQDIIQEDEIKNKYTRNFIYCCKNSTFLKYKTGLFYKEQFSFAPFWLVIVSWAIVILLLLVFGFEISKFGQILYINEYHIDHHLVQQMINDIQNSLTVYQRNSTKGQNFPIEITLETFEEKGKIYDFPNLCENDLTKVLANFGQVDDDINDWRLNCERMQNFEFKYTLSVEQQHKIRTLFLE